MSTSKLGVPIKEVPSADSERTWLADRADAMVRNRYPAVLRAVNEAERAMTDLAVVLQEASLEAHGRETHDDAALLETGYEWIELIIRNMNMDFSYDQLDRLQAGWRTAIETHVALKRAAGETVTDAEAAEDLERSNQIIQARREARFVKGRF